MIIINIDYPSFVANDDWNLIKYIFLFSFAFQDSYSLSSFFLSFASSGKTNGKDIHDVPRSWASDLREYTLSIVDKRKSSLPLSQPQEIYVTGKTFRKHLHFSSF